MVFHRMETRAKSANIREGNEEKVGRVIKIPLGTVAKSGVRSGDICGLPTPDGNSEASVQQGSNVTV